MKMRATLLVPVILAACGGAPDPAPVTPNPPAPPLAATQAESAPQPAPTATAMEAPPAPAAPDNGGYSLVAPASLQYQPLNPGQQGPGPEIAVARGDLKSGGAFFLRLPPGAKPGLHTHTSDYQAVVISGMHKHWLPGGEAKAKPLPPGSYWFQPGGQPHGDECTGKDPCVLFLVMPGALDFTPAPNAKPGPVGKYTLTVRKDDKFGPLDPTKPTGPKLAVTMGDPKVGPVAFQLEVPAGGNAGLHSHTNDYQAVVVDGAPAHWLPDQTNQGDPLAAGTYWFQPGGHDHGDRCTGTAPCHVFVFFDKPVDFLPPKSAK